MSGRDEFYVGWQPEAPERLGRRLRVVVLGLLAFVAIAAIVLVTRQDRFSPGVFEFGDLEVLYADPSTYRRLR